jgi:hypothetical protein
MAAEDDPETGLGILGVPIRYETGREISDFFVLPDPEAEDAKKVIDFYLAVGTKAMGPVVKTRPLTATHEIDSSSGDMDHQGRTIYH